MVRGAAVGSEVLTRPEPSRTPPNRKCSGLSVNKDNNILFCFIPGWRFLAMSNMFTQNKETAVPCLSHCDCTCLLKAAARKIKRSEEALKCGY